jgi:hypothetical protein
LVAALAASEGPHHTEGVEHASTRIAFVVAPVMFRHASGTVDRLEVGSAVTTRLKAMLLVGVVLTTAVLTTGIAKSSTADAQSFVSRRGANLVLDGRKLRYLSFNAFTLTGCGLAGEVPSEAEIDEFLGSQRRNSMVRTWLLMNSDLDRFDAIVRIAAAHDQKLIPVLTDHHGSCGDPEGEKSAAWYADGFREQYLPWLRTIVGRYRDEPAIGMWELVNEPSGSTRDIRKFFDVAGREIHRLDPNHLVESGAHAPFAYGGAGGWKYIHASPGIDVTSVHEYDMNAGVSPKLLDAVAQADALDKPLVLGEVGVFASTNGDLSKSMFGGSCVSFATRVTTFRAKLDATFRTTVDGVNVWNWMPRNKHICRLETYPDDPLVAMIRAYKLRRAS